MFYTGCSYRGEYTADGKRFHEQGVFTFANGDTYVGSFNDGRMHGAGTLFFAPERGGGQYRGVWENGRSVSGAFVFADGLVYGPRAGSSGSSPSLRRTPVAPAEHFPRASLSSLSLSQQMSTLGTPVNPEAPGILGIPGILGTPVNPGTPGTPGTPGILGIPGTSGWLYCREGDRRLWAEHLREVMPVLPSQTVLGGTRVPHAARWGAVPVVAPSVAVAAKIPAAFAQGQPRTLGDIPKEFWCDADKRANVVRTTELPTPRFRGAQRDGGEETFADGRPEMNLTRRIIKPVEPSVVRAVPCASGKASPLEGGPRMPRPPSVQGKGFTRHSPWSADHSKSFPVLRTSVPPSANGSDAATKESREKNRIPAENQAGSSSPADMHTSTGVLGVDNADENPLVTTETQTTVDAMIIEQTNREEISDDVSEMPAGEQEDHLAGSTNQNLVICVEANLTASSGAEEKRDRPSLLNVEQLANKVDLPTHEMDQLSLMDSRYVIVEAKLSEVGGSPLVEQKASNNEICTRIMEGEPARSPLPRETSIKEHPSSS